MCFIIIIILVLLKTTNFKIHKQKEMLKIMQYCKNLSVPLLFLPLKVQEIQFVGSDFELAAL